MLLETRLVAKSLLEVQWRRWSGAGNPGELLDWSEEEGVAAGLSGGGEWGCGERSKTGRRRL